MSLKEIASLGKMLAQFLALFADCFYGVKGQRLLSVYVRGLLSNLQRKNVEAEGPEVWEVRWHIGYRKTHDRRLVSSQCTLIVATNTDAERLTLEQVRRRPGQKPRSVIFWDGSGRFCTVALAELRAVMCFEGKLMYLKVSSTQKRIADSLELRT